MTRRNKQKEMSLAYRNRIEKLCGYAELDGFGLNEASRKAFWKFVENPPFVQKAGLVLPDDGNLRARWKDKKGNLAKIQFLGNSRVKYVIFKSDEHGRTISQAAGFGKRDDFEKQLDVFDLRTLVYL